MERYREVFDELHDEARTSGFGAITLACKRIAELEATLDRKAQAVRIAYTQIVPDIERTEKGLEERDQRIAQLEAQLKATEGVAAANLLEWQKAQAQVGRLEAQLANANATVLAQAETALERKAQVERLREALRELDERLFLDCLVEPPCGNCTRCRARAALNEQPQQPQEGNNP